MASDEQTYAVGFKSSALKSLQKLPEPVKTRILEKASLLKSNKFPTGSRPIKGHQNIYRLRCGNYRIVYVINVDQSMDILALGHRQSIYRDF